MAGTKKYYWMKLKDDFFSSKRIKKLRKIAGGDTYTIIYLKMQLLSLSKGGILEYTGLEESFAEELALDLDEDVENVKVTLQFLLNCGLLETSDDMKYLLPFVVDNIGSETASALRGKEYRASLTDEQKDAERERARLGMRKIREQRKNVTECYERVTNVDIDIDKDIEIDNSNISIPSIDIDVAFNEFYERYKKKKNYATCKMNYFNLFKGINPDNYEQVANLITGGMALFAKNYVNENPDDKEFKYLPSLDVWLKEDALYWMKKAESKDD